MTNEHVTAGLRPEFAGPTAEGLGLIWAQASGGVIGKGGDMPWHLPEDLAHFKQVTFGAPVIMGRRTWESLPERVRPLPGRQNIVVTRNRDYEAPGADVVTSLQQAIEVSAQTLNAEHAERLRTLAHDEAQVCSDPGVWPSRAAWVMGGGELYRLAMPFAAELVVTQIDLEVVDGDTFAPEIGPEWRVRDEGELRTSKTGLNYRIRRYARD